MQLKIDLNNNNNVILIIMSFLHAVNHWPQSIILLNRRYAGDFSNTQEACTQSSTLHWLYKHTHPKNEGYEHQCHSSWNITTTFPGHGLSLIFCYRYKCLHFFLSLIRKLKLFWQYWLICFHGDDGRRCHEWSCDCVCHVNLMSVWYHERYGQYSWCSHNYSRLCDTLDIKQLHTRLIL